MNEQRWLTTDDLESLLQFLRSQPFLAIRLVDRKLMYWMAEALRKFHSNHRGANLVEEFAEERLSVKQLRQHDDFHLLPSSISRWLHKNVPLAALQMTQEQVRGQYVLRPGWNASLRRWVDESEAVDEWEPRRQWLVALLRELFGNPWAAADPDWRYFHHGLIPRLIDEIRLDGAWDLMPILGDALEDGGCDHPDILSHCRADVTHRKGCWVLDLIGVE